MILLQIIKKATLKQIATNNVKELTFADISPSGFVCVRGALGDIRAKEPSPACNTLSAINLRLCSGSFGLRQGQLLLTEAAGTGWSYKAKPVEGLPKDLIRFSFFKQQLLIWIWMPCPLPNSPPGGSCVPAWFLSLAGLPDGKGPQSSCSTPRCWQRGHREMCLFMPPAIHFLALVSS